MRLRRNLAQIAHLIVDATPSFIASSKAYVALRRSLSRTPGRFAPARRGARPRRGEWLARKFADPGLDLVVDGFPGSANSYVSNSLRVALSEATRVTSHFHYTVQIKRALALDLPLLVVVRAPRAACSSFKAKEPELWDWLIGLRWLLYHRYVWRNIRHLDVVLFDEVTEDLAIVARRSARTRALLGGRHLAGDPVLRRETAVRLPISSRGVSGALLRRADRLYARIRSSALEATTD